MSSPTAPAAAPAPPPEAAPRAPEVDPEVQRFASELRAAHARMMAMDSFAVLGVTRLSPSPEVMRAYLATSERWRPSRWEGRLPAAEIGMLREISSKLDEAFSEIGTRQRHVASRRVTPPPVQVRSTAAPDVAEPPPSEVEILFAQGKDAFARGFFADACAAFERCIRLEPDAARYHLKLGQAALRLEGMEGTEPRKPGAASEDAVKPHFDRALELEPENIEVLLAYGHFLKARGEISRSMRYFKEVRDQDPRHHEARREIRLYLSRKRRGGEPTTTAGKIKKLLTTKL